MKSADKKTVAVIGLGRFGEAVASRLVALGHEVIGIDASAD
ncbi:NAD(P)-dependent oxidoreductase, partial [Sphingorhabdus sp.]